MFDLGQDRELIPEFVPTEERFYAVVPTKAFRKVISRMVTVSKDSGIIEGTELIKISAIPQQSGVAGYLQLTTTDGTNFFSSNFFDVKTETEEDIYVPAKKLSDVLKLATGEVTTISCVGFSLGLVSGNSKWTVALPSRSQMRRYPEEEFENEKIEVGTLNRTLRSVIKASATGFSRASLMQIQVGEGVCLASDGLRLHRVVSSELSEIRETNIPTETVKYLVALLSIHDQDKIATFGVSDSLVKLEVGDDSIVSIRTTLPLPDVEKAFISQSVLNDSAAIVDTKELKEALISVKVFATDALSSISMIIIKDSQGNYRLMVSSEDEIGNASRTVVSCSFSGKNQVSLKLNYKHVMDVIESIESDMISIRVGKNTKTSRTTAFFEDMDKDFTAVVSQTVKD